jgi:predicted ATPase
MAEAAIADARDLGHLFSIAHGLHQAGLVFALLEDIDTSEKVAVEILDIAERNRFPWPMTYGRFLNGWLKTRRGDHEAGIRQMMAAGEEPSAGNRRPILMTLIVDALLRAGRYQEAFELAEKTQRVESEMRFKLFGAEIHRLKGEALLQINPGDQARASDLFREAIVLAGEQECRTFELRAATSLARLHRGQDRREDARNALAPVYGWFTEGFDWPDLKAAKTLLDELG